MNTDFTEKLLIGFVALIALIAVGFIGTAISLSMFASGKIDFCYIEHRNPSVGPPYWTLMGFRDWRQDERIGVFGSLGEAKAGADLIDCPLSSVEGNENGVPK